MAWEKASAFWGARDAWTAARMSAQASRPSSVPTLSRTADQWASSGAYYLRSRPDIAGWIREQGAGVSGFASRLLDAVTPATAAAFDTHLSALAFAAWRAWPVASGYSRSRIDLQFDRHSGSFVGRIVSGAPYTFFIKGQPFRVLIGSQKADVVAKIGAAITAEVARG